MAVPAMAGPTLGTILSDPAYNSISASGASYVRLSDLGGGGDADALATILLEQASFADENIFGIFDRATGMELTLFVGDDTPGDQVVVNFDIGAGTAWINTDEAGAVTMGSEFGFWVDSSYYTDGGKFYTDSSKNTGADLNVTHGIIYETTGVTGINGMPDVVVAMEDLIFSRV